VLTVLIEALEQAPGLTATYEERQRLVAELATIRDRRNGPQAEALRLAAADAAEQVIAAQDALKAARERSGNAERDLYVFHVSNDTQESTIRGRLQASAHPAIARLLRDLQVAGMNAIDAFNHWTWKPFGSSDLVRPTEHSNGESILRTRDALTTLTQRAEALRYMALSDAELTTEISAIQKELEALRHIGDLPSSKAARGGGTAS
jgi:hypothetical protein